MNDNWEMEGRGRELNGEDDDMCVFRKKNEGMGEGNE